MRIYTPFIYSLIIGCSTLVLSGCDSDLACWPICSDKTTSGVTSTSGVTPTSGVTSTSGTVTLIAPNGDETWEADGSKKESISWSKSSGVSAVKIELYKSDVLLYEIRDSDPDIGASWTITRIISTGNDYKIKITSTDDATIYDFSDASFSILGLEDTD
jgi:hypothetical protein